MIKRIAFTMMLIIFSLGLNAQVVEITATQSKANASKNTELNCIPVKLRKKMKITKVEGDCKGFWIVKDHKTIHDFNKNMASIGLILEKGTYYVYPHLKKDKLTASITISLELLKENE